MKSCTRHGRIGSFGSRCSLLKEERRQVRIVVDGEGTCRTQLVLFVSAGRTAISGAGMAGGDRGCPAQLKRGGKTEQTRRLPRPHRALHSRQPSDPASERPADGPTPDSEYLTFDDVLMKPGASPVLPAQVSTATRLTRSISLSIPIISAAMDTVTEAKLAIAMAQAGGIGVIHKNLEPAAQAEQVRQVKRFEAGMVVNPITIGPEATLADVMIKNATGFPAFRWSTAAARWSASSPTAMCALPPTFPPRWPIS
jgi:hypothetical protein